YDPGPKISRKSVLNMAFCPNCQSDLPAKAVVCPDCRQMLSDKSDIKKPVASAPDDSWVAVARIKGIKLAEKARNALDANNIPSMLMPKSFSHQASSMSAAPGVFERSEQYREKLLMVPKEYQGEAKFIVIGVLKRDSQEL
ncbi:MAG: hypothetical protein ACREBV_10620, partial [Candidatus Zixiibacteriota bacterium]